MRPAVGEATQGLSRAEFIPRAAAVGVSATSMSALLAACGSSGGTGTGGTTPPARLALTTPAAHGDVGSVTWAVLTEPSSLDWRVCYATAENTIVSNVTESLLQMLPDFSYAPALAESYTHPNSLTYVFKIRSGVTFHDGSPLTADDVVFSLGRSMGSASFWSPWLVNVKTVTKTGPDEVTVTLKRPDVLFIQMMALPAGGVGKAADIKAKGDAYGSASALPIGTGPFKAQRWQAGTAITLARNEHYWDPARAPKAGRLVVRFIEDEAALTTGLLTGAVDGSYLTPFTGVPRLRSSSEGRLFPGESLFATLVFFTAKQGPFGDPRVRRAWQLATDRSAIAKAAYNGMATGLPNTFLPLATWRYGRKAAEQAYAQLDTGVQLEQAKQLIQQAGSPKGRLVLAASSKQLDNTVATILQSTAQSIGLDLSIDSLPYGQIVNLGFDEKARNSYDAFLTPWYGDIADPLQLMIEFLMPPQKGVLTYNYNNYDNPQVTRLLRTAQGTEDEDRRAQLIIEAQRIMSPEVPVLGIAAPAVPLYLNKRLTGPPASFAYLYRPWAAGVGAA